MNDWTGFKKLLVVGVCLLSIPLAVVAGEISVLLWWVVLLTAYAGGCAWWKNGFPKEGNSFAGGFLIGGVAASIYLHWWIWMGVIVTMLLMGAYMTHDEVKKMEEDLFNMKKA